MKIVLNSLLEFGASLFLSFSVVAVLLSAIWILSHGAARKVVHIKGGRVSIFLLAMFWMGIGYGIALGIEKYRILTIMQTGLALHPHDLKNFRLEIGGEILKVEDDFWYIFGTVMGSIYGIYHLGIDFGFSSVSKMLGVKSLVQELVDRHSGETK